MLFGKDAMKYALIADIHGNMPALSAVIADARAKGVRSFVFLGDYCIGLANPNEVADCIRSLSCSYVVGGNEDTCFSHLTSDNWQTQPRGQYEAVPYYYGLLTEENRKFLRDLPGELTIDINFAPPVHLFHKPQHYFDQCSPCLLNPQYYADGIDRTLFSGESFYSHSRNMLNCDESLKAKLASLSDGVYAFGHTHIQWSWRYEKKLLISTGSCGLPLDFNRDAAYCILEWTGTDWIVKLYRVPYDVDGTVSHTKNSDCAKGLPVWLGVIGRELETAREQAVPFVRFAEKYAMEIGDPVRPFTADTWYAAYDIWSGLYSD